MNTIAIHALRAQVDAVFDDEADFDEVMLQLDDYLAAQPDSGAVLRLRAQMHASAYDQLAAWADWKQVVALAPEERDAVLELARLQLRWARRIAESMLEDEHAEQLAEQLSDQLSDQMSDQMSGQISASGADDELDDDAEALDVSLNWHEYDPRIVAEADQLQQQGIAMLQGLMHRHASDLEFAHSLVQVWDDVEAWQPWQRYEMLLCALTAHPYDRELRKQEALFLFTLCCQSPVEADEGDEDNPSTDEGAAPLLGYFDDVLGNRYHALTLEQALQALDLALAGGPDPDLLGAKATLLVALDQFESAAQIYTQQAALFDGAAQALDAAALDAAALDERESLIEQREQALHQAASCSKGKSEYARANFALIAQSLEGLVQMQGADDEQGDSDIALPDGEQTAHLRAALQEQQALIDSQNGDPDPEQAAEMQQLAQKLVGDAMRTLQQGAQQLQLCGDVQHPWLAAQQQAAQLMGWQSLAHFSNSLHRASLGPSCQGQFFSDATHQAALICEVAERAGQAPLTLRRMLTELTDGTVILTADTRQRLLYAAGAQVLLLTVEPECALVEMAQLHLARVARHMASTPGMRSLALDSLATLEALENRLLQRKNAFRRQHGLADGEMRGVNVMFYPQFVAMVKQAHAAMLPGLPD